MRIPGADRQGVLGWTRSSLLGRSATMTATGVIACLVVGVTSPQSAIAGPMDTITVSTAPAAQRFASTVAAGPDSSRDGFSVRAAHGVTGAAAAAPGSTGAVVAPVAGTVPVAGGFGGRRVAGCSACSTNHQGIDFAAPTGTPVRVVLAGTVVAAGWEGGYGKAVLVRHANGLMTRYGHLSRLDVRVGQAVGAGVTIGAVGSTGVSTGSHLHFEVIVAGGPIDPAPWLRAHGVTVR